jgi:AAA+ ATPase superfamily predicted ATPase
MEHNGVRQKDANALHAIDTVFGGITSFIDEGRTILADEFGKEYGTYFTILSAIASGRTTYAQIVNEVGMEVGGYLTRLETQYELIAKRRPFLALCPRFAVWELIWISLELSRLCI